MFRTETTTPATGARVSRVCRAGGTGTRARGFTFTEIMFAVVILGVGFIMIAAVFPVAIRMNAQSAEETAGTAVVQRAVQLLQSQASDTVFPITYQPTGAAVPPTYVTRTDPPFVALGEAAGQSGYFLNAAGTAYVAISDTALATQAWQTFRNELVTSTDTRFGCAVAFARSGPASDPTNGIAGSNSVRVVVVTAQVRGERQGYNDEDTSIDNKRWGKDTQIPDGNAGGRAYLAAGQTPATLQFKRLKAVFQRSTNGTPDRIRFTDAITGDVSAAGEGAYVIIANVNTTNPNDALTRLHGRIVRLGVNASTATLTNTYQLVPGQDVTALRAAFSPPAGGGATTDQDNFDNNFDSTNLNTPEVEVLVLGRMLADPTIAFDASSNPYVGPVQDVSVYSTIIGLNR